MRKLSQKAWNNVLIFSMLILIVVLNYDSLFSDRGDEVIPLVPEGAFVTSMQINQLTFERIGSGWRVSAPSEEDLAGLQMYQQSQARNGEPFTGESLNGESMSPTDIINNIVSQWQTASMRITDNTLDSKLSANPQYIVSLNLAGENQTRVYGLLTANNTEYVIYQGELYLLDFPNVNQLVPFN
uniref:hypothetical protein n=1 Tax=Ningiella ruwaisensis TaxID=2364274 RepID=UPI0010A08370|nr:hypothetical protein [Ningiella ruwaisensis]